MSAIAGLIDWRGGPAAGCVRLALAALDRHGRDGQGLWDGGDIVMGWRQTILAQEDFADQQPRTGGAGRFRLVFDGRLDNREDLAPVLALHPEQAREWPDSAYVMAAFEKWGEDSPKHLLGSFAFAVWDCETRSLFLARDPFGERPLVYHQGSGFFIFATHPAALFTHPQVPDDVSDEAVIGQLILRRAAPDATFFSALYRIPCGHRMTVTASHSRIERYWHLEDTPDLHLPNDDDYVDAFREIFTQAVRCRLRTIHPVGGHLSSGWDSSSVVATAAPLLAARGERLCAFTSVPQRDWQPIQQPSWQIADEGPLAALTAARFPNVDHHLVEGPGIWDFAAQDHMADSFARPIGVPNNAGWYHLLHTRARQAGIRVMLAADIGNLTISYDGTERFAALFRQAHFAELIREWLAARKDGRSARNLLRLTLMPLLRVPLADRVMALAGRPAFATLPASFISTAMLAGVRTDEQNARTPNRRSVLERMSRGGVEARFGYTLAAWDIDLRDPTIDRRVATFCYSIPSDQFFRNGVSRRLLRRAMTGVLPAEILNEKGRGRQAANWCDAALKARTALLQECDDLQACPRTKNLLDTTRISAVLRDAEASAIAKDQQLANRFHHALLAINTGRFVRRALQKAGARAVST